jgi:VWFA-related protein
MPSPLSSLTFLSLPLLLAAQATPPTGPAPQPTFPARSALVRIDAVVLDRDGRPVEGLRAADFELLEDGRPQPIESFEAVVVRGKQADTAAEVPVPRPTRRAPSEGALFVVFYDDLHLTPRHTVPARDALRRLLAEGTRPGDRVTLVAPEQGIWWTARLDEERGDLLALTGRLHGRRLRGDGRSDYEAMLVHHRGDEGPLRRHTSGRPVGRAKGEEMVAEEDKQIHEAIARGESPMIPAPPSLVGGPAHKDLAGMADPMEVARLESEYREAARLNKLALTTLRDVVGSLALVPGRKSLVYVSEGIVEDTDFHEFQEVVDEAQVSNTIIYFLDVRGFEAPSSLDAAQVPPTNDPMKDLPGGGGGAQASAAALLNQLRPGDPLLLERIAQQGAAAGSEKLADETGGHTLRSNDLGKGMLRIAAEAHCYYLLGYAPADTARKGFRKIGVRVKRPGLELRARPGWRPLQTGEVSVDAAATNALSHESVSAATAATPASTSTSIGAAARPRTAKSTTDAGEKALGTSVADRPPHAPGTALDLLARSGADLADVPLAVSTYVFDETSPGHARVLVAADIDLPPSPAGTEVDYRMLVVPLAAGTGLQHAGTATLEPAAQLPFKGGFGTHAPLVQTFELAPGRYQARLAVELAGRAGRGAATRTFDVPQTAGLRVSTPILSHVIGERGERAPRPILRGLKAFWPSDSLFCQFEVFGAVADDERPPSVAARYRIVAANGSEVRTAPETTIEPTDDHRLMRLFGFPLRVLPPGVYTLQLDVRDTRSGAAVTAIDTFRVLSVRR